MFKRGLFIGIAFALSLLACTLGPAATPTLAPPVPTPPPAATLQPTLVPQVSAPSWWPDDLTMPQHAIPTEKSEEQATWSAHSLAADDAKDFLMNEAKNAGYQTYVITLSPSSIYDLLFVKGKTTFTVNITQGMEATVLTGGRTGTMHLEVTGAITTTVDLPLRERFDPTPGSETVFGTSVPGPQCSACQYLVYIHIAPFNGAGIYESKPVGTYLVDVQLDPGGDLQTEDYRWAQQCTVIVQDALTGSFACAGLENIYDNTKRLNMIGSWQESP